MGIRSKNISKEVSQRIRALRVNKNLTQKELSEILFKSESTIRMWELGKSEPDLQTMNRLAEIFNVNVDYLIGRSDFKEKKLSVNDSGELPEDIIVFHRDGKTETKKFTKEQMKMLLAMIDAIPENPKDI